MSLRASTKNRNNADFCVPAAHVGPDERAGDGRSGRPRVHPR